ncbi:MAG: 23S rRNA (guanosine(2251)-2'-O)-methyltransferase RlmB [Microscillaceae bacterium]|nr:23S rRNA (guanosine(2251)-2'-O)-methyltransferase RlmB [Microscillaceae bacterium]MDW8461414.1 23S rRNA (guanosine(2251)-2'-O)-methyltransferase RlmB [Cytophagales bacterium]
MQKNDFVFGIHSVLETLKANTTIDKVLIQKDLQNAEVVQQLIAMARSRQIPISRVPLMKLNKITAKNHQGVIALLSTVNFVPLNVVVQDIFEQGKNPLILVLDRITDVRNFGAIVRSAECAGVHAVVVPYKETAQIGSDAMKTSSGALNYVPICKERNLRQALNYLKNSGLQIIACTEKSHDLIYKPDFSLPTAIIMGSEEDGINPDLLKLADNRVKIPMQGKITSLNVAVSAGIILYEVVRQRLS